MADLDLDTSAGVTAASTGATLLADITADGVNTITVDSIKNLRLGMQIDILTKSSGAALASNRNIDGITAAGVVTYSGADVAAVAGTHGVYAAGAYAALRSNVNGGLDEQRGFEMQGGTSIEMLRDRLAAIDAGFYTAARLNTMTKNDMIYAVRLSDYAGSIKQ